MKQNIKAFLFNKNILVSEQTSRHPLEVLLLLADSYGIKITEGEGLASEDLIEFTAEMLGQNVPEPFYRGFPESVRKLSRIELVFDQLIYYFNTYGIGNFNSIGHSLFEQNFDRVAFREEVTPKPFVIINESMAADRLKKYADEMLASSRPLNPTQYEVLLECVRTYGYDVTRCACKDTAVKLLFDLQDFKYAAFLKLSDVIKLVDDINYTVYRSQDIKCLNFRNRDRVFIKKVMDKIFEAGVVDVKDCFEKKAIWCGLLHHIHYVPKTDAAKNFVKLMRGWGNQSAYSEFEKAMRSRDIKSAVDCISNTKGSGALLRNLNYILSRCINEDEQRYVLNALGATKPILLIQLLLQYANYDYGTGRVFKFTRHNMLKVHTEDEYECEARRSVLTEKTVEWLKKEITDRLVAMFKDRFGKVYIDKSMYRIAVPIQENTASSGFGVLPKGSRKPIPGGKVVRAFTYWEKVNDIDLSVFGITDKGEQKEFSWRNMAGKQSQAITFSGDEVSGYNGGSEYFDIDIPRFIKKYPNIQYLIFCNNVFSRTPFSQCVCRAGYMLRDGVGSGEIYEPKTVQSSFTVNCDSTFAYLFGIDLRNNDFVWLNVARNGDSAIAGNSSLQFLTQYFNITEVINLGSLFEMMAQKLTLNPAEADVIVSDDAQQAKTGATVIRSTDIEKILSIIS